MEKLLVPATVMLLASHVYHVDDRVFKEGVAVHLTNQ
jgi:hypothetical protein